MITRHVSLDRDPKGDLYLNFKLILESGDFGGVGNDTALRAICILDESNNIIYTSPSELKIGDELYNSVLLNKMLFKKAKTEFTVKYIDDYGNSYNLSKNPKLTVNTYKISIDNIDIKKEIVNGKECFRTYLFWKYDNYSIVDLKVKPYLYYITHNALYNDDPKSTTSKLYEKINSSSTKKFTSSSVYTCKAKATSMSQMSYVETDLASINANKDQLINMVVLYRMAIITNEDKNDWSKAMYYPENKTIDGKANQPTAFRYKASSINSAPVIKLENIQVLEKGESFQLKLDSLLRDSELDDVRYVINDNQGNVIFQEDYYRFTPRIDSISFDYDVYAFNSLFLNLNAEISDNLAYSYKRSFKYPLFEVTNLRIRRDRLVWDVRNYSNSVLKTTVEILDMYNNVVYTGDTIATRLEKKAISVTDNRVLTLLQEVPEEEFYRYYKFRIRVRCDDEDYTDYVEFENGTLVSTQHHKPPTIVIYENKYPEDFYDINRRGKNYDHLLRDLENNKRLHLVFELRPKEGSAVGDYCKYIVSDDSGNTIYMSRDDITSPQLIDLNVNYDFTKRLYNTITIKAVTEYGQESTASIELASYYIRKAEVFTSNTVTELPDSQKIYLVADNYYEGDIKITAEIRDFSKVNYFKRQILKQKDATLGTNLAKELDTFKDYLIDTDDEVFKIISEAPIIQEQTIVLPNTIETIHHYIRVTPKIYYNERGIPYNSIIEEVRDEFGELIYGEAGQIQYRTVENPLKCILRIEGKSYEDSIRYDDKYKWVYRYLPPMLNTKPSIVVDSSSNKIDPVTNILTAKLNVTIGDNDGDWVNFSANDRYGVIENRNFYDLGLDKVDNIILTKKYDLNKLDTSLIQWNLTCFDEEGLYDSTTHRIPLHYISNIIYDGDSLQYKCKLFTKKSIVTLLEILDDEGYMYARGKETSVAYDEGIKTVKESIDISKFDSGNYRYRIKVTSVGENWSIYYPSLSGELIYISKEMIDNMSNTAKINKAIDTLSSGRSRDDILANLHDIYGNTIPMNEIISSLGSDKIEALNILSNYHDHKTYRFRDSIEDCLLTSKPKNAYVEIFNGFNKLVIDSLKYNTINENFNEFKNSMYNSFKEKVGKSLLEFSNIQYSLDLYNKLITLKETLEIEIRKLNDEKVVLDALVDETGDLVQLYNSLEIQGNQLKDLKVSLENAIRILEVDIEELKYGENGSVTMENIINRERDSLDMLVLKMMNIYDETDDEYLRLNDELNVTCNSMIAYYKNKVKVQFSYIREWTGVYRIIQEMSKLTSKDSSRVYEITDSLKESLPEYISDIETFMTNVMSVDDMRSSRIEKSRKLLTGVVDSILAPSYEELSELNYYRNHSFKRLVYLESLKYFNDIVNKNDRTMLYENESFQIKEVINKRSQINYEYSRLDRSIEDINSKSDLNINGVNDIYPKYDELINRIETNKKDFENTKNEISSIRGHINSFALEMQRLNTINNNLTTYNNDLKTAIDNLYPYIYKIINTDENEINKSYHSHSHSNCMISHNCTLVHLDDLIYKFSENKLDDIYYTLENLVDEIYNLSYISSWNKELLKLLEKLKEAKKSAIFMNSINQANQGNILNIINDIFGFTETISEDGKLIRKNNLLIDYEESIKSIPTGYTNYGMSIDTYTYNLNGYPLEFKIRESDNNTSKYSIEKYTARVFVDGKKVPDHKINSQLLYDGLNKVYIGSNDLKHYASLRNSDSVASDSNPHFNSIVDIIIEKNLLNLAEGTENNNPYELSNAQIGVVYDEILNDAKLNELRGNKSIDVDIVVNDYNMITNSTDFTTYVIKDKLEFIDTYTNSIVRKVEFNIPPLEVELYDNVYINGDASIGTLITQYLNTPELTNRFKNGFTASVIGNNLGSNSITIKIVRVINGQNKTVFDKVITFKENEVVVKDTFKLFFKNINSLQIDDRLVVITNNSQTKGTIAKQSIANITDIQKLSNSGLVFRDISAYNLDSDLAVHVIRPFKRNIDDKSIKIEESRINLFRYSISKKDGLVNVIIKDPIYVGDIVVLTTNKIYERQYLNTNQMYGGYTTFSNIQKPTYFIPISLINTLSGKEVDVSDPNILYKMEVFVNGYLAIPQKDYVIIGANEYLNLPPIILFKDLLFEGTELEIFYHEHDILGSYKNVTMKNGGILNIGTVKTPDGLVLPLCRGAFSVFCNGKKVPDDNIFITSENTLVITQDIKNSNGDVIGNEVITTKTGDYFIKFHFPDNKIIRALLSSNPKITNFDTVKGTVVSNTLKDLDILEFLKYVYEFADPSEKTIAELNGKPLKIVKKINSSDDLPEKANKGDGYLIGELVWMYNGTEFISLGKLRNGKFDFIQRMHDDLSTGYNFSSILENNTTILKSALANNSVSLLKNPLENDLYMVNDSIYRYTQGRLQLESTVVENSSYILKNELFIYKNNTFRSLGNFTNLLMKIFDMLSMRYNDPLEIGDILYKIKSMEGIEYNIVEYYTLISNLPFGSSENCA